VKLTTKSLISLLILAIFLAVAGCSDVQNREKSSEPSQDKSSSISIKVTSRSTTNGTQTTATLDKEIEKAISKTLSQVLISGEGKDELFTEQALAASGNSFPNYKKAQNNTAEVSIDFMNSEIESERVIAVSFSQEIKLKDRDEIVKAGKIYFDTKGTIVGFAIPESPLPSLEQS